MKTRDRYPSDRPPEPIRTVLDLILGRYFHMDVAAFRFNIDAPDLDMRLLRTHCNDVPKELHHSPKFHPDWPYSLVLLQPRQRALAALLTTQCRVQPSYGEFALDLQVACRDDALRLFDLILRLLAVQSWRREVVLYNSYTAYFSARCLMSVAKDLKEGVQPRREGKTLAVYVRRSKNGSPFAGEWCVHLEWRISGSPALRDFCHVVDVGGLVNFDHPRLWLRKCRLWREPSLASWGAWSDLDDLLVDRKTLIERGREYRDNYVEGNQFILQNSILDQQDRARFLSMFDGSWTRDILLGRGR